MRDIPRGAEEQVLETIIEHTYLGETANDVPRVIHAFTAASTVAATGHR